MALENSKWPGLLGITSKASGFCGHVRWDICGEWTELKLGIVWGNQIGTNEDIKVWEPGQRALLSRRVGILLTGAWQKGMHGGWGCTQRRDARQRRMLVRYELRWQTWSPGGEGEKEVKEGADEIGASGGNEGSETSLRSLRRHRGSQSLQEAKM